jgi:hypothetical protein
MGVLALLCVAAAARAQPTADQVLSEVGMSAGDRQRVMRGEFVTTKVAGVSERDLAFASAVVLYMSHAFTDQVAGAGGSVKGSMGSRIMADRMKEIFENGRKRLEH